MLSLGPQAAPLQPRHPQEVLHHAAVTQALELHFHVTDKSRVAQIRDQMASSGRGPPWVRRVTMAGPG